MPHVDHMSDMAEDLAFVNSMSRGDVDRRARYLRRRTAAVAWIPGMLLVGLLAGSMHNGWVALAGLVVLVAALWFYAEMPIKS